jgi:mycothiol system anti-sigma-R factor
MSEKDGDCQLVEQRIFEFHDGEVTEAEGHRIRQHLFGCEACTGLYEAEQKMREFIKRGCSERAPEGLLARIKESFTAGEGVAIA